MTNNDEAILITNPDRRRYALLQLKYRLKIETETSMKASSRGPSTLFLCEQWGYEGPRSKKKALAWATEELEQYKI